MSSFKPAIDSINLALCIFFAIVSFLALDCGVQLIYL